MIEEIRSEGGCLRLLVSAIVLAFLSWFVLSLILMALGQIVDVMP